MLSLAGKGKAKDLDEAAEVPERGIPSGSDSGSDCDSSVDDREFITSEYLESLLTKAKAAIAKKAKAKALREEEEIIFEETQDQKPLPPLDPGPSFPRPYFSLGKSSAEPSSLMRDVEAEHIQQSAPSQPAPPPPPPELTRDGKPLTKRQKKERKNATAGPNWFDLPAPAAADLPRLYREVEALRLRNSLDPKRFYRREEGEGKGIKGLPKHFAIGTIIPSSTPFGTPSADNLPRAKRKRTVVEELVDDAEARQHAKKKFSELQSVRAERGRGTWKRRKSARRGKW